MGGGGGLKPEGGGVPGKFIANISCCCCFFFFLKKGGCISFFCGLAVPLKVMLHETIRNDDL